MESPATSSHLYRCMNRIATPAEIPNTVSATDCAWLKYPALSADLHSVRPCVSVPIA